MVMAVWNGVTIADSDDVVMVEGNAYFPMSAVLQGSLVEDVDTRPTYCHWKGIATYFNVLAGGGRCHVKRIYHEIAVTRHWPP